jgi:hypothetical protein
VIASYQRPISVLTNSAVARISPNVLSVHRDFTHTRGVSVVQVSTTLAYTGYSIGRIGR